MATESILITSAGAKVLLVQAFVAPGTMRVLTGDAGEQCAAHSFSDGAVQLKNTDDPAAIKQLIDLCQGENIRLIVPTRDGELAFFAAHQQEFADQGVKLLVPSPENLAICQSKSNFADFLAANDLPALPSIDRDMVKTSDFPLFIRPITGAGGRGTMRIDNGGQLSAIGALDNILLHPFIDAPEYSIDLLMDLEGNQPLQAVCRERLHVVGGEAKISKIVEREDLCNLAMKLGEKLCLVGHNVVQLFDDSERGPMFIEVNPRFGGASNLSIKGGLDSPERILALLNGDNSARSPRPIQYGLTMLRYSLDVMVEGQNG